MVGHISNLPHAGRHFVQSQVSTAAKWPWEEKLDRTSVEMCSMLSCSSAGGLNQIILMLDCQLR